MPEVSVGRDRVATWRTYQKLPPLQRCVQRDEPVIEVFGRAGEARFSRRPVEGRDAVLDLSTLALSIPLAEIHRDVLSA